MRRWLSSPTGLKVVSVVLATVTWTFVRAITSDSRLVEGVPLEVRVKQGMIVTSVSANTVNVTVRGATEDLRMASRNELYAVLDLANEEGAGTIRVPLGPKAVRHPRRVQVVAVEPSEVTVRVAPAKE